MTTSEDPPDSQGVSQDRDRRSASQASSAIEVRGATQTRTPVSLRKLRLLLIVWIAAVVAYLFAADALTAELTFIGVFLGFLGLLEVISPNWERGEKRTTLRWILLAGYLLFGYFMYDNVMSLVTF